MQVAGRGSVRWEQAGGGLQGQVVCRVLLLVGSYALHA